MSDTGAESETHAEVEEFLVTLGEQPRDGDELTVSTDEWELPFPDRTDETAPDVS